MVSSTVTAKEITMTRSQMSQVPGSHDPRIHSRLRFQLKFVAHGWKASRRNPGSNTPKSRWAGVFQSELSDARDVDILSFMRMRSLRQSNAG